MKRVGAPWFWLTLFCLAITAACDQGAAPTDAGATVPEDASGTCPSGMVFVPGGEFTMGSNTDAGDGSSAPAHRVRVSSFCLDATPVTAAAYAACVTAGRCPMPTLSAMAGCAFQGGGSVAPGFEASPMNCVAWTEADNYCRTSMSGGALPTEAQWEFAATNGGTTRFPWGNAAPTAQLCWSGTSVRGGVCPVAAYPASPRGLRDMVGNVWVWTQDWFANYPSATALSVDPPGPASGTARTFRGASFGADSVDLLVAPVRGWNAPSHRVPQLGFRCASSPDVAAVNPG